MCWFRSLAAQQPPGPQPASAVQVAWVGEARQPRAGQTGVLPRPALRWLHRGTPHCCRFLQTLNLQAALLKMKQILLTKLFRKMPLLQNILRGKLLYANFFF